MPNWTVNTIAFYFIVRGTMTIETHETLTLDDGDCYSKNL